MIACYFVFHEAWYFILCFAFQFQDSEKYVEQLLTLFNRFSKLVKEAFQDDPRFLTARDKVSYQLVLSFFDNTCLHVFGFLKQKVTYKYFK